MPSIRLVVLWHMHQPFYKDLVTGEYRLPWVRLHALKDYYGMVKLLDEFPDVHQTFNLVPSLIDQIQDYVNGTAHDPFLTVASKPARELSTDERRFALAYLFQTNPSAIARYPRYQELLERFRGLGESPERGACRFERQEFTDLQVLSQIAWFDEFFLEDPDIDALIRKGSGFDEDDQKLVIAREREILAKVLPAYADAAHRGSVELSTSPHYHPILPLLCDTDAGGESTPGLKLPRQRFRHPEDARIQLERGLVLHERTFGLRPRGAWPSEGSVSEPVLEIAHQLGVEWLATDEGVLGRSIGFNFVRDGGGHLCDGGAERLYRVYRYEKGSTRMHLLFRDHMLSDLIGFVYSGMPPREAAENFIQKIKSAAKPVLDQGRDAVVPIILDGENAWEYYPQSGREFLRRLYDGFQRDPQITAVTASEAIHGEAVADVPRTRAVTVAVPSVASPEGPQCAPFPTLSLKEQRLERRHFARLDRVVPGSWINANFNVWIGAPEDNRAWDYLSAARDFYANQGITASDAQRALAFEEILIAEGSDWNWWYGPEHHSANDRDFDELYRKHLSNVYLALDARPPDYLSQPIIFEQVRPAYTPQTGYIHPRIGADYERYFEWMGAAMYTADRRAGAMHGKQFLLDSVYAGIDEENLYGRLDFASLPEGDFELRVNVDAHGRDGEETAAVTLEVAVANSAIALWMMRRTASADILAVMNGSGGSGIEMKLRRNFVFKMPLSHLKATHGSSLRVRFGLWRDRLPLDALPLEGWLELQVASEDELEGGLFNYSAHS